MKIASSITLTLLLLTMTTGCVSNNQAARNNEFTERAIPEYFNTNELPLWQQKNSIIAALTASGDTNRLRQVFPEALEAGLTVNEIKEVLIHTHAYCGFPRALNAINTFIAVMDEREAAGIRDNHGREANPVASNMSRFERGYNNLATLRNPNHGPGQADPTPVPRYVAFTPAIEDFLKEHLFGDVFSRDVLDWQCRQLATVGVISNLPGANAQLRSHINLTMIQGATVEQMRNLFINMEKYVGTERSENALSVLQEIINSRS
jgi:alkylhydroperoxidase/carboxymuconolactone decarboxylase family protein YurZ